MALRRIRGLSGATVFDVRGWGRARQQDDADGHEQQVSDFEAHAAVAVFCPDELSQVVVAAIARADAPACAATARSTCCRSRPRSASARGERGEAAV